MPVPIIAAVNGAAYAGGMEIALCCDFIYAAEHARFALTEVTLGIMPGAGGTQTLPRAVGARRAKEILLTGKPFTAQQGFEWGMVNRICAADTLLAEALETAAVIAGNAPISTRQIKQSVNYGLNMDLASGMMFEIEAYNRMVPTETAAKASRVQREAQAAIPGATIGSFQSATAMSYCRRTADMRLHFRQSEPADELANLASVRAAWRMTRRA